MGYLTGGFNKGTYWESCLGFYPSEFFYPNKLLPPEGFAKLISFFVLKASLKIPYPVAEVVKVVWGNKLVVVGLPKREDEEVWGFGFPNNPLNAYFYGFG